MNRRNHANAFGPRAKSEIKLGGVVRGKTNY